MERFSRTEKLIGKEKLLKLNSSSAFVFGAGAVGSFAAEALVRSGIGEITIIDFDTINRSNINRQLYALESTLGRLKTETAQQRLSDINPDCRVKSLNKFVDTDNIPNILAQPPNIVIDAIDSVGPKIELLAFTALKNIPVVSSMGAARRLDPAAVRVGDLFQTAKCPLARLMRKALRRRGISSGIMCVYSDELPKRPPEGEPDEDLTASGHSVKILGSMPTVTGIFGLLLADTAIKFLIEKT